MPMVINLYMTNPIRTHPLSRSFSKRHLFAGYITFLLQKIIIRYLHQLLDGYSKSIC